MIIRGLPMIDTTSVDVGRRAEIIVVLKSGRGQAMTSYRIIHPEVV